MCFFLDREGEGLECFGIKAIATGEDGWSDGLVGCPETSDVATNGKPIVFDNDESGDLGRGEVKWLRNVSDEVK